jgi:tRNA threonylcarbamoyladenosine biosynthesis protein TsaE
MKVRSTSEMGGVAEGFLKEVLPEEGGATIVCLFGELGSGKTTFVKSVAHHFGIKEDVTSPTFVIQKIYHIPNHPFFRTLVHIDAYRLQGGGGLKDLRWEDTLKAPDTIIFIEWPENVKTAIPKSTADIYFSHINEGTREVVIKK